MSMATKRFTFEGDTFRSDDWHACSAIRVQLWRKVAPFCKDDRNYAASGFDGKLMKCSALITPDCWPLFMGFVADEFCSWTGHDLPIEAALTFWKLTWQTPQPIGAVDRLVRTLKPWHLTMHELDQRKPERAPVAWSCPTCGAGPQRPCKRPSGRAYNPDKFIHRARVVRALSAHAAEATT